MDGDSMQYVAKWKLAHLQEELLVLRKVLGGSPQSNVSPPPRPLS